MKQSQRHIGIDVGKAILDICIYETDEYFQVGNNAKGIALLIKK